MAIELGTDVEYVGAGASGGIVMGRAATDLIGFFGITPVVQQSVTAPATTATTTTNEAAIKSINAALVALGLVVTT